MIFLSKYTPAEVIILTKRKTTFKELFKITLGHLFLKEVINSFNIERQIDTTVRLYEYVKSGSNFINYSEQNYENFFLSVFKEDQSSQILFRSLIKIGYENSRSRTNFKNKILKIMVSKKYVNQNIFQKNFSKYSLTPYGYEIKEIIENEIKELNSSFDTLVDLDNAKSIEIGKLIGGNIFFLENIDCQLFSRIDKDLSIEIIRYKADGDYDCT